MMADKLWNSNYFKVWTGNFFAHFAFTLIVPLLPLYLNETFGASKDTIGLILAGYTVTALLVRPFSGYLVDSYPRKTVLLVCFFLFSATFLGYIAAGSLTMFAIFRTIHGAPFGATSVSLSTVAIDSLPSSRRSEGIGYYGLSTNLATVIGPVLAIAVLNACGGNFRILFIMSAGTAFAGLALLSTLKLPDRIQLQGKKVLSLDRFFLLKGLKESVSIVCFATSYGVISTYVAIYGKEELGLTAGTGIFFSLFAIGLIVSRLTGAHALRENKVSRNAAMGIIAALCGYSIFAIWHQPMGYYLAAFVIGLGNGHMYPAFQNMFVNLAEHNQRGTANSSILTAWDAGVGIGMLMGGFLSEHFGYHPAFQFAATANAAGAVYYFLRVRSHFEANKLR